MNLNNQPLYPSAGRYVLRLHRDARAGFLAGRVEHVATGESIDFRTADDLLAWLRAHSQQVMADAATDNPGTPT